LDELININLLRLVVKTRLEGQVGNDYQEEDEEGTNSHRPGKANFSD
jgi:hypothetical protein